jgi:hypothetical protein
MLAPTLQAFFTDRLARQRDASPHTIAAYRDTWRLLLAFVSRQARKQPSLLEFTDLDAPLIGAFLDHLEHGRGNSPRTRNARLAAVHSLFRYAALRHPEHAEVIARVLAIPPKRFDRALVTYLTEPEIAALLAVPGKTTWAGRRDHTLILLAAQTGLRISELTGLTCAMSTSAPGPTSAALARAANSGSHRSPAQPSPCCGPGSPSAPASQTSPCSPPAPAGASAATPSNDAWPSTQPLPQRGAHPFTARQ